MSPIGKPKRLPISLSSSVHLFGQLGEMFSKPEKVFSTQKVSASVNKSLRQLQNHASPAEIQTLRKVLHEISDELDRFIPVNVRDVPVDDVDEAALRQAQYEDRLAEKILPNAMRPKLGKMSTKKSIRQGNEAMAKAEEHAQVGIMASIENRELISSGELQRALNIKRQAISGAVKAKRLFAIVGPSGENYYPAYFADPTLDRRTLEKISKALGSLPAQSKHHFFTSKLTTLQETPLDALRNGSEAEVLAAAIGFAER